MPLRTMDNFVVVVAAGLAAGDYIPFRDVDGATGAEEKKIAYSELEAKIVAAGNATLTGAVSSIKTTDLAVSRALTSDGSGKVAVSAVMATELGRLAGVTSGVQGQIDGKQPADPTLTALAGLTVAANSVTVGTGADAFTQISVGLNQFLARGSAGDLVAKPITDYGFSLVDDVDAPAARSTLGLGSMATQTATDYATVVSPALTGVPTVPTASVATNDTQAASTAFVQAVISAAGAGLLDLKTSTDCSANPNYAAASKGDTYFVSVAGKIGGASGKSVDVGDLVIATADNAGGTEASVGTSWIVLEHNLAGALLSANNLSDVANAATARTNLGLGTAATPTFAGLTVSGLTATRVLVSSTGGLLAASGIGQAELNTLFGMTGGTVMELLAGKQATITGAATTIASADLTASRVLVSNGSGKVAVSTTNTTVLAYLNNVSSDIQAQIGTLNNAVGPLSTWGEFDPSGFSATSGGSDNIDLEWVNNNSFQTDVVIQQNDGTGVWNTIATLGPTDATYEVTGLTAATNYEFRVRGRLGPFSSGYQQANATTDAE